jgi:hypothetical protein
MSTTAGIKQQQTYQQQQGCLKRRDASHSGTPTTKVETLTADPSNNRHTNAKTEETADTAGTPTTKGIQTLAETPKTEGMSKTTGFQQQKTARTESQQGDKEQQGLQGLQNIGNRWSKQHQTHIMDSNSSKDTSNTRSATSLHNEKFEAKWKANENFEFE